VMEVAELCFSGYLGSGSWGSFYGQRAYIMAGEVEGPAEVTVCGQ
jgi:hypothetical protein